MFKTRKEAKTKLEGTEAKVTIEIGDTKQTFLLQVNDWSDEKTLKSIGYILSDKINTSIGKFQVSCNLYLIGSKDLK